MRHRNLTVLLTGLFVLLAGCGQKGALFLPTKLPATEPDKSITKVQDEAQVQAPVESKPQSK